MKIREICTSITDGSHNPPQGVDQSKYLMLSSKNVFDDAITLDDPRFLAKEDFAQEYKRTRIMHGDVLLTIVGTVGRCAVVPEGFPRFTLQRSVAVLHPKTDVCSSRFLMYALRGKQSYIEKRAKGVAQKGIYLGEVADIEVDIPAIDEQASIIKRLDSVVSIVKKRQQELAALDDLIKARFVEMFGTLDNPADDCRIKTIQDVCEPIKDGTHQTPEYTNDTEKGFLFLSSKDVTTGYIDWDHPKYIPESLHRKLYSHVAPKAGDILIAKNGTTGIAAVVDRDAIFDIYVSLAWLRPLNINSTFLWSAINSEETKRQFDSSLKGIGVPNLHLGEIKKTRIVVGSSEHQLEFAAFVDQIQKAKATIQKSLSETQTLFDCLMQQYFG